ncbi:MAG: Na(+)/H(+) antiporter subunit D [Candidatus Altiarchaeota archaeon]|nr:Na(+)/H(+) antiporter subunit D [Candidatus Altiarchaeota archaeon]
MEVVPPASIFLLGAFLVPLLKGRLKKAYLLSIPLLALIDLVFIKPQTSYVISFLNMDLILLQADGLSLFVGSIFVIIGFLCILYSLNVREDGQHFSSLWYIGSSLGVVFAGDLFSLLFFWEIMAVSSVFLIWYQKGRESIDAGFRYILMHIFGGSCLLAGTVIHYSTTKSIAVSSIDPGISYILILIGVGLNAVFIPLHTWLPDAYPKATITGAVFMSVYTTKTGVYVLARMFPGVEAVAYMGGLMALYGVTFALLQNDVRKLLSYHIISQVGYMVAGIGLGTALGINGGLAHLFNNILYKTLLFMCAGAMIYRTGKSNLTELGGLARKMPITATLFVIAALSISGVVGFNGFVSKGMVLEASHSLSIVWLLLELASVGTLLSFLKVGYYGFFRKNEIDAKEAPQIMLVAMLIIAFLCIIIGLYPDLLLSILPYSTEYHPFSPTHVLGASQLLMVTGIFFLVGLRVFSPHDRVTFDFDYIYGKLAGLFLWFCRDPMIELASALDRMAVKAANSFLWFCMNPRRAIDYLPHRLHLFYLELVRAEHAIEVRVRLDEQRIKHMKRREQISISVTILLVILILLLYLFIYEFGII